MEVSMKLGQAIYESQQAEAGSADASAGGDDHVVDADYEEIKDEDDRKRSA
jgi:molecular chaperone DnaK